VKHTASDHESQRAQRAYRQRLAACNAQRAQRALAIYRQKLTTYCERLHERGVIPDDHFMNGGRQP